MIQLIDIKKSFGGNSGAVHAVNGVSLSIEEGSIYGIVGFSGAGKSTLVRCINLLERPDNGSVIIGGVDLTKLKQNALRKARKRIGMIFQLFNLLPSRTARGNVMYPLRGNGKSKRENIARADELLDLVELSDKKDAYPSQLSGGQKQRVAIARALASNPSVLLCDEATSALDPQTTQSILWLLRDLNRKLGITIVIITHEMAVVKEICTHMAVMENGKIVESGEIYDIFSNPQSDVTRRFLQTTLNQSAVSELIEENNPILNIKPGNIIARIEYTGAATTKSLVSHVSRSFNIDVNIISGTIEVIQSRPLGLLTVIFDGQPDNIDKAIEFLRSECVKVEVIKNA